MHVRSASPNDAATVVEIVRDACAVGTHDGFLLSGAEETYQNVLADLTYKSVYLLCRETDGYAVATVRLHIPPASNHLYITRVAVRPEWQRRGLAGQLLTFAAAEATRRGIRALRLDTPRDHGRLVRFYQSHGFSPAGQTTLPGRGYPSLILERVLETSASAPAAPTFLYAGMVAESASTSTAAYHPPSFNALV